MSRDQQIRWAERTWKIIGNRSHAIDWEAMNDYQVEQIYNAVKAMHKQFVQRLKITVRQLAHKSALV